MGVPGDRGRAEVYAAELMAFDGTDLEEVEPFATVAGFVQGLIGDPWWPGGPVVVRPSRPGARTSTARTDRSSMRSEIRLAEPQCTRATAVHELAHVLAGPGVGHGPGFRRAHVDIASVAFGAERSTWLADAYRTAGLELGDRSWPAPAGDGRGSAIAL